jgi:hypothetical protein
MKICFKQSREVIDMMRNGISTEHFSAKVTWPYGFDSEPIVTVSMRDAEFEADNFYQADDVLEDALTSEIKSIKNGVHSLLQEIGIFAADRDCYRNNMQPFGCYKKFYAKKGNCA